MFTSTVVPANSIIEISPVIVLSAEDLALVHRTHLHDYYFLWEKGQGAIALGYGSIYNHASRPNADYHMNYVDRSISFVSLQAIDSGEEITVNYIDEGDQRSFLWFEEIDG